MERQMYNAILEKLNKAEAREMYLVDAVNKLGVVIYEMSEKISHLEEKSSK